MRTSIGLTLALLGASLVSPTAAAPPAPTARAAADGRDLGRLNPQAPPETAQFSFLIGERGRVRISEQ